MLPRACSLLLLTPCVLLGVKPAAAEESQLARFPARFGTLSFELNQGHVVAEMCAGARCDVARTVEVPVPPELVSRLTASMFTRYEIEKKRSVVHLEISTEDRAWEALITAPLDGKSAPGLAFADWTGMTLDDEGERTGRHIEIYEADGGLRQIVVGDLRGDVELCGRPTMLDPKVLYPEDLALHRIKLVRLPEAERANARVLTPVVDEPSLGKSISRAVAASSAKGSPAFLSDGNPKTAWAEDRGGDGRGEFAVLKTPELLPVSSFSWTLANADTPPPKAFWIATDHSVYRVVPEETSSAGQRFRVDLPAPEATSCVALVLDGAESSEGALNVGLAEFEARAAVDGAAISGLVSDLDDPNKEPDATIRTLAALGKAAVAELSARYRGLSPAGKSRAVVVYDSLPCEDTASAYVDALSSTASDGHLAERVERCGEAGEKAVLRALPKATGERAMLLAGLLAHLDPERAAKKLVPLLSKGNRDRRRALRAALASIATRPEASPILTGWLEDADLSKVASIDLLRALGDNLGGYQEPAAQRVKALLSAQPDFRTRYLLVEPMARLGERDPALAEALRALLNNDQVDAVRAHAARSYPTSETFVGALVQAADDPHVRVREAAIANLTEHAVEGARAVLLRRMTQDPWPFIRAASVKGLLALEPSPAVDAAFAQRAAEDAAPDVRRPALLALGTRDARAHVEVVRERLGDDDEDPYVRAAAAATLGTLCDRESVEELDRYARAITRLSADEDVQVLGRAAVSALGRLHPPDLSKRLAAFDGELVPPWAKQAADAARDYPEPCPR